MNRKRRSKALEKIARAVKDTDDFVEHIGNIARGFAARHELDAGAGAREVRRALKSFDRHCTALQEWFRQSARPNAAEHEALRLIDEGLRQTQAPFRDSPAVRAWLTHAVRAGAAAQSQLQRGTQHSAPLFAASALRATFEHHGLKVSPQATPRKQSDAVTLLCAIAKDGGDPSLTPAQARQWLIQSGKAKPQQ